MDKLEKLAKIEGFEDSTEMMNEFMFDSVAPGICTNPDCDYTATVEPDQDGAYCEECKTNTVKSCFVLAGVI